MSDELGFNKIAGAVLATALAFMGIKELAHAAYHPHAPEVPAYGAELLAAAMAGTEKKEEVPLPFPQPEYIAAMDAAKGASVFNKCKSCHSVEEGGANMTGPNLYGVLNNQAATHAGFAYSAAMTEYGKPWTYEALDNYLAKPRSYVPGTIMSFVGLKKEDQRAAVIAYLRSYGDADTPLPEPAIVEVAVEEETVPTDASVMQDDPMEAANMAAPETDDAAQGETPTE